MGLELPHNIPINKNSEQVKLPVQKHNSHSHPAKEFPAKVEKKQNTEPEFSTHDIEKMIKQLENSMRHFNRRLKFQVNKSINRIVVKVIDNETNQVIREVPPREIQKLIAQIRETIGLLYDNEI